MPATHEDLLKDLQLERDLGSSNFYKTVLEEDDTVIAYDKQLEKYEEADIKDSLLEQLAKENQDAKLKGRTK